MAEPIAAQTMTGTVVNVDTHENMQIPPVGAKAAAEAVSIMPAVWNVMADTLPCCDCGVVCW